MPAKDNKGKGNPKDDGESCFVAVNVAAKKCPEKATKRNMIDDDKGTPNKEGETNKGIDELHKGGKAAVGIMTFTDDKHNEQAKDDKGNEVTTDDDAKGTGEDDNVIGQHCQPSLVTDIDLAIVNRHHLHHCQQ